MLTPAELRELSRSYRKTAETTANPHFKRYLASHALALAQLAENIERREAPNEVPATRSAAPVPT